MILKKAFQHLFQILKLFFSKLINIENHLTLRNACMPFLWPKDHYFGHTNHSECKGIKWSLPYNTDMDMNPNFIAIKQVVLRHLLLTLTVTQKLPFLY